MDKEEIETQGFKLAIAAIYGDGANAASILKQVPSSQWRDIVLAANITARATGRELFTSSVVADAQLSNENRSLFVINTLENTDKPPLRLATLSVEAKRPLDDW